MLTHSIPIFFILVSYEKNVNKKSWKPNNNANGSNHSDTKFLPKNISSVSIYLQYVKKNRNDCSIPFIISFSVSMSRIFFSNLNNSLLFLCYIRTQNMIQRCGMRLESSAKWVFNHVVWITWSTHLNQPIQLAVDLATVSNRQVPGPRVPANFFW